MEKEGVITEKRAEEPQVPNIDQELKSLEGMKCKAPHTHQWGDTVYHNAMVCSVVSSDCHDFNNIQVDNKNRVLKEFQPESYVRTVL